LLHLWNNNEKVNKHRGVEVVDEMLGLNIRSIVDVISVVLGQKGSTLFLNIGTKLLLDRLVLLLTVLDNVLVSLLSLLNDFNELLKAVTLSILEVVPLEIDNVVLVWSLILLVVNEEEVL